MNKQVKISVRAFSVFGEYISVPDFDSIVGDGERSGRHFVTGIGEVVSCKEDADMFPAGSKVVFSGYISNDIKDVVETNVNNIAAIHGDNSLNYVLSGYTAFVLNVLDKAHIAIGENVLIDIQNKLVNTIVSWALQRTTRNVVKDATLADVVISDKQGSSLMVSRGEKTVNVAQPADLSNTLAFSGESMPYPPHYITASMTKLLQASVILLKDTDASSLVELLGYVRLKPFESDENTRKCEYSPQWPVIDYLHKLYSHKTDAALITISLMVGDTEQYAKYMYDAIQYVLNEPCTINKLSNRNIYRLTARANSGSVVNCNIVCSKTNSYDVTFHADGESYVLNDKRIFHYSENNFDSKPGIQLIKF